MVMQDDNFCHNFQLLNAWPNQRKKNMGLLLILKLLQYKLQKKNTCTPQPGFSEGGKGRHRNAPNLVHILTHISTTTTAVAIELGDGIV